MSLSHTTSSKVFLGFWRSHGTIIPEGPVLTLSTRWSKLFGNLIALLISWAVFRLYRILTAIIFYLIFKDRGSSFDNSMATTMVVNIQSPLDGIFVTILRLRRRKAFILIFATALFAFLLSPAIVVGLSLLPSYRAGRLLPDNCGLAPIATDQLLFTAYNALQSQWADAALRDFDGNVTDPSTDIKATLPTALPTPSQSYALECPPGAAACTVTSPYTFTFTSNYTLHSSHFGLDTDSPFSFHVSDTCYRARGAIAQLPIDIPGNPKQYGLFYGPLNFSSLTNGQSNSTDTPYTESVYAGGEFRSGYRLSQHYSRVNDLFGGVWRPNSTLLLGGDTTILFYYIGGVAMAEESSDPLFATEPSNYHVADRWILIPVSYRRPYRLRYQIPTLHGEQS